MENDVWSQFPEVQEEDPWAQFPEVEETAPEQSEEKNSGLVETITNAIPGALGLGEDPRERFEREQRGEPAPENGVAYNTVKGITGGLINAAGNVAQTVAAVGSYSPIIEAYKYLTDSEGPEFYNEGRDALVGAVDKVTPEFHPDGTAQELGALGTEIGAGVVAGNKMYAAAKAAGAAEGAVASLAEKMPKVVNYFSRLLTNGAAQAAGTSSTVDEDVDTLLIGENAIVNRIPWTDISVQEGLPILQGLDGKNESEAQAIVEKRLNIFMDAMVLAAPVELIADGGKAVFGVLYDSFLKPIHGVLSDSKKQEVVFETFIQNLRNAIDPDNPNSAVADQYVSEVITILKDDENAVVTFPGLLKQGPEKVEFDVATTVNRGLEGDSSDAAVGVKKFFDKSRKEVQGQPGVQRTQIASEAPGRAVEKLLDEGYEAKGGAAGVEKARRNIVQSGEEEVAWAEANQELAERNLSDTGENYGRILAEDEGLGPRMLDAANQPGSKFGVDRNQITKDIVDSVRAGNQAITKAERTVWGNIPEGLPVNEVELNDSIADAAQFIDSSTKKAFKESGVDIDAILKGDADEFVEDAPVADFAKLQNTLRKPLQIAINRAKTTGAGYEELLALKKNITDLQPEWLSTSRKKGAKAGVKALDEAVEYTRETAGPVSKSGLPKQIRKIDQDFGTDKVGANQAAFEEIEKAMTKKSTPMVEHLADVMSRPEYGGKQGLLVDHALASVADDMNAVLRSEGVTGIKPADIIKTLNRYRSGLNAKPDLYKKELQRLDDFEKKLLANANNAKKLEELAKQYSKDFEKTRKRVYEDSLREFFSKEGIPNPSGQQAFNDVFLNKQVTSADNVGKLDDLIERMDPPAREGALAAWLKTMKEQLSAPDGSLNTTKTSQTLEGRNHLMTIGRKLAGEDYQIVDVIEELLYPAQTAQLAKKSSSIKSAESTVGSAAAKRAANRMVLATKGPLTKFGGRVSAAVGTVLDILQPDNRNLQIADAIMADRKEFLKHFKAFETRQINKKNNLRSYFNWLVKMGIYNDAETNFNEWKQEVERLNTEYETEEALQ